MNPQSWLEAFVQRNLMDLARVRGYTDTSLATAMRTERNKRPYPGRVQGEVVAMDVRDRILLSSENPVFQSGNFTLKMRPNRAVRLVESATGLEVPLRKVPESPYVEAYGEEGPRQYWIQEGFFDISDTMLPEHLMLALVWSVDRSDALGEFRAVIVAGAKSLDRSPLVVCASVEIPPLESLSSGRTVPPASPLDYGFGNMVQPRKREIGQEEDGTGGASPGA